MLDTTMLQLTISQFRFLFFNFSTSPQSAAQPEPFGLDQDRSPPQQQSADFLQHLHQIEADYFLEYSIFR